MMNYNISEHIRIQSLIQKYVEKLGGIYLDFSIPEDRKRWDEVKDKKIFKWIVDLETRFNPSCPPWKMEPKGTGMHNAGSPWNGKSLHNYNRWSWRTFGDGIKGWHLSIGEDAVWQALPLVLISWSFGDGAGDGNLHHIACEIARDTAKDELYFEAEENASIAVAIMNMALGFTKDTIKRHFDFSGKICPLRWFDAVWDAKSKRTIYVANDLYAKFKERVAGYMSRLATEDKPVKIDPVEDVPDVVPPVIKDVELIEPARPKVFYRVQSGAFSDKENAKKYRDNVEKWLNFGEMIDHLKADHERAVKQGKESRPVDDYSFAELETQLEAWIADYTPASKPFTVKVQK